jgi:uncharacterized protein YecE (DUF72 family)
MAEFFFGVAGWSYPDWKGIVYPPEQSRGFDELGYIASFFDSIELNNTFYRIPATKMVESWAKRVSHNPRFQFTAKIWQGFTHEKKSPTASEIKEFFKSVQPLTDHLGSLLAQFPTSFKNDASSRERLDWLAELFAEYPLVIEFRHRSWAAPDILQWLEDHEIGFCNVDEPMFRHMLKPSSVVTGPIAYVRFHGRNYDKWYAKEATRDDRYDYLYAEEELDQWIPRIGEMGKKAKKVYVIGNNHFRGQAPANILQLKSKITKGPVSVPDPMLSTFPQLKEIAKPVRKRGQGSLFEE